MSLLQKSESMGGRWQEFPNRRLFQVFLNLGVALVVSVWLIQRIQSFQRSDFNNVASARIIQSHALDDQSHIYMLLNAQLFGQVEAPQDLVNHMATSRLNIVLNGVMATSAKDMGIALLSVDGGPEEAIRVGEEVLPGVKLVEVKSEGIILSRDMQLELVALSGADDSLLATLLVPMEKPSVPSPTISGITNKNTFVVVRHELRRHIKTPQELLSQAVMVPNKDGGFLLKEIRSGSLVERFGLRPGDVVRKANGQALNYANDIRLAYQQLADARHLKLEILRDGKSAELNYQIQ